MKIGLGILLLVFCTLIGYFLAGKYVDRKNFYNDFINFNQTLKQQILFNKSTLVEIVNDKFIRTEFYCLLKNKIENKKVDIQYNYLNKDDQALFDNYVKNIGTSDVNTQIEFIDKTNELLTVNFNQALEQENKYKILYIKMGFLIGLTLMIIVL